MSVFVVDASALLGALFEEISDERRQHLLRRIARDGAVVPAHFPFEVFNAFEMARHRSRFDAGLIGQMEGLLAQMAISVRLASMAHAAIVRGHAERHRLTVYDAAYLELALSEGLDLITLDDDLFAAASRVGMAVAKPKPSGPRG